MIDYGTFEKKKKPMEIKITFLNYFYSDQGALPCHSENVFNKP